MSDDTKLSGLFSAALNDEPLPVATPPAAKSSCCSPKPAAATGDAAPKASSCCGPKPAAEATATAVKAKSSCCG